MNCVFKLSVILALSTIALQVLAVEAKKSNFVSLDSGMGLDLSGDEIVNLEQGALNGDGMSAVRLSMFYANDYEKHFYWITIAAEDGNILGQTELGKILDQRSRAESDSENTRRDKQRAAYWLNLALKDSTIDQAQHIRLYLQAMKQDDTGK